MELDRLEKAVIAQNPLLADRLQPGLPESKIRRAFSRAHVTGSIEPLVEVYRWRNGTVLDQTLALSRTGFFPCDSYHFVELDRAIGDMGFFKEASKNHPRVTEAVGRYFPLFWNGDTDWIAIDIAPSFGNRVMIIEYQAAEPFREAYSSVEEFFADAIRANEEGGHLRCFDKA